jgi:hypothetical protein
MDRHLDPGDPKGERPYDWPYWPVRTGKGYPDNSEAPYNDGRHDWPYWPVHQ